MASPPPPPPPPPPNLPSSPQPPLTPPQPVRDGVYQRTHLRRQRRECGQSLLLSSAWHTTGWGTVHVDPLAFPHRCSLSFSTRFQQVDLRVSVYIFSGRMRGGLRWRCVNYTVIFVANVCQFASVQRKCSSTESVELLLLLLIEKCYYWRKVLR